MKRIAFASMLALAFGCGEPKAPPPGSEGSPDKLEVEIPSETGSSPSQAPTEDKGAPTDSPAEKDSAGGAQEEK